MCKVHEENLNELEHYAIFGEIMLSLSIIIREVLEANKEALKREDTGKLALVIKRNSSFTMLNFGIIYHTEM
jgi:hypothetical protein